MPEMREGFLPAHVGMPVLQRENRKRQLSTGMNTRLTQDEYCCDTCVCAADIHGRSCRHGLMFSVLLLMTGHKDCPNYKFDREKARKQSKEGNGR